VVYPAHTPVTLCAVSTTYLCNFMWCIRHIPLYLYVLYPAHTSVTLCGVSSTYLCKFVVYPAHTSITSSLPDFGNRMGFLSVVCMKCCVDYLRQRVPVSSSNICTEYSRSKFLPPFHQLIFAVVHRHKGKLYSKPVSFL
jgi:hypothetical protein